MSALSKEMSNERMLSYVLIFRLKVYVYSFVLIYSLVVN